MELDALSLSVSFQSQNLDYMLTRNFMIRGGNLLLWNTGSHHLCLDVCHDRRIVCDEGRDGLDSWSYSWSRHLVHPIPTTD